MAAQSRPRAVLLDALGTLMSFEPPAPRLRVALRERTGVDVGDAGAEAAMRAEIAYYRAHLHEGADAASLAALRVRCAEAMRPALPGLPTEAILEALLAALRPMTRESDREQLRATLEHMDAVNVDPGADVPLDRPPVRFMDER
jgi:putative hydrolase of the HAD superfamily